MNDFSAAQNPTERTPLISNAARTQPSQRRHRSTNWNLGVPTRRRLVVKRTAPRPIHYSFDAESSPSPTCASPTSPKAERSCEDVSTASLSTCHEEGSTSSLSRTASVEPDEEPVTECYSASWQPGILMKLHDRVSLTLENQGSVARDHLASERTFLAYVRTSLSLASAGVALVQLYSVATANGIFHKGHRMHTYIRPLGGLTIGLGLTVMVIGLIRYFMVQQALTKGYFPVSRLSTAFMALFLITLVILTFSILIAGKLEPKGF